MIRILIEATLDDSWIQPENEGDLDDAGFIEMVNEDLPWLMENARWRVVRDDGEPGEYYRVNERFAAILELP